MTRLIAIVSILLSLVAGSAAAQQTHPQTATAIFAGGCFWCMQPPFDKTPGVISTTAGYTSGTKVNPTYEEVSSGTTGHFESVKIEYDPAKVNYDKLLDVFWHNIDPFNGKGQFCDIGPQYRAAIFYGGEKQKEGAEASKKRVMEKFGKAVDTLVLPASEFYPAEDYHQEYHKKNPLKYKFYRFTCGRDARLEAVWGNRGE